MTATELELTAPKRNEVAETTRSAPSIMDIIAQAASNPNVDVDRLERLIAMSERAQAREAEQAFNMAMNKAQHAIRPIAADASNPQTRSKYASYLALDKALRPIYTQHGFALSFDTGDSAENMVRVVCYVSHKDGHSRTYHVDMPADGKGPKGGEIMSRTHATGAALSYGARYLLKLVFNVAIGEDDNDGNGAEVVQTIDADQMQHILDQIAATDSDIEQFCKFMGVDAVKNLTVAQYGKAMQALNAKARKAKK
jgi:hypothetical protein